MPTAYQTRQRKTGMRKDRQMNHAVLPISGERETGEKCSLSLKCQTAICATAYGLPRQSLNIAHVLRSFYQNVHIVEARAMTDAREIIAGHQIRTGDTVLNRPSGEEWLVAWADHQSGYMAPCGWPTCEAKIADCTIVKVADDATSDKLIDELSQSGRTDAHRASSIRDLGRKT